MKKITLKKNNLLVSKEFTAEGQEVETVKGLVYSLMLDEESVGTISVDALGYFTISGNISPERVSADSWVKFLDNDFAKILPNLKVEEKKVPETAMMEGSQSEGV